jgi:hypothetical protein
MCNTFSCQLWGLISSWLANSKWVKSPVKTVRDLLHSALTALTASTAHVWCALQFGVAYLTFNVLYIVAFDGTNTNEDNYIYDVID